MFIVAKGKSELSSYSQFFVLTIRKNDDTQYSGSTDFPEITALLTRTRKTLFLLIHSYSFSFICSTIKNILDNAAIRFLFF